MSEIGPVIQSFQARDQLNPLIWNDRDLDPKVHKILVKVVKHFIGTWNLNRNINIKDIRFTGSLAAFNWSKFSDIDLHIVVNFSDVNDDEELVNRFFTLARHHWNNKHDVKIGPFEIEVYVENEGEDHKATGLYSVKNQAWIKEPTKEDQTFDKDDILTKTKYFFSLFEILLEKYKKGQYSKFSGIEEMKLKIKKMRQSGLDRDGQFSVENLTFKVLRRTNFLKKVENLKTMVTDKKLAEKTKN